MWDYLGNTWWVRLVDADRFLTDSPATRSMQEKIFNRCGILVILPDAPEIKIFQSTRAARSADESPGQVFKAKLVHPGKSGRGVLAPPGFGPPL